MSFIKMTTTFVLQMQIEGKKIQNYEHKILKGTVMQIEKALKNDGLCVSKVSSKFCIPNIYNFEVIYPGNFPFS